MEPTSVPESGIPPSAFELEEYIQVLHERQFVMTRYMQAVGLYVTLSGFALKELVGASSANRVWILFILLTVLNVLALFAARQFRNMAHHTMVREMHFVQRYNLQQTYQLFWGYYAGVILVCLSQATMISVLIIKLEWPWSI